MDADTDADAGGAADGERGGDAELVVLVAGGDAHRLVGVRAGDVGRRTSAPQLMWAALPMCAVVWTVTTLTAPERFTAARARDSRRSTPTAAMSSLFVAVTLTPRNESRCRR